MAPLGPPGQEALHVRPAGERRAGPSTVQAQGARRLGVVAMAFANAARDDSRDHWQ